MVRCIIKTDTYKINNLGWNWAAFCAGKTGWRLKRGERGVKTGAWGEDVVFIFHGVR
jgi:hypothetical protein